MRDKRTALVVGSTGLIGSLLLQELQHFSQVVAVSRKPILKLGKSILNRVVDFSNEKALKEALIGTDLFFCYGTTLKSAGSKEAFLEIEWEGSKRVLQAASDNNVQNLYLVSSMGASSEAAILYSRVKGQIEEFAKQLAFKSVTLVRPSLLLGIRNEWRLGESFAQIAIRPLNVLFLGPLLKYKAIKAELVAKRLSQYSQLPQLGVHVYENDDLFKGTDLPR